MEHRSPRREFGGDYKVCRIAVEPSRPSSDFSTPLPRSQSASALYGPVTIVTAQSSPDSSSAMGVEKYGDQLKPASWIHLTSSNCSCARQVPLKAMSEMDLHDSAAGGTSAGRGRPRGVLKCATHSRNGKPCGPTCPRWVELQASSSAAPLLSPSATVASDPAPPAVLPASAVPLHVQPESEQPTSNSGGPVATPLLPPAAVDAVPPSPAPSVAFDATPSVVAVSSPADVGSTEQTRRASERSRVARNLDDRAPDWDPRQRSDERRRSRKRVFSVSQMETVEEGEQEAEVCALPPRPTSSRPCCQHACTTPCALSAAQEEEEDVKAREEESEGEESEGEESEGEESEGGESEAGSIDWEGESLKKEQMLRSLLEFQGHVGGYGMRIEGPHPDDVWLVDHLMSRRDLDDEERACVLQHWLERIVRLPAEQDGGEYVRSQDSAVRDAEDADMSLCIRAVSHDSRELATARSGCYGAPAPGYSRTAVSVREFRWGNRFGWCRIALHCFFPNASLNRSARFNRGRAIRADILRGPAPPVGRADTSV